MSLMLRIIRVIKHVHFTQKVDNQLIPQNPETRSRVNNKIVIPRYSNSKCQNALIFRGIKLWSTTPDDIKQSPNLAIFKKISETFYTMFFRQP